MKINMLTGVKTRFFISVAKRELFAYKITREEAFNFSAQLFDWERGNRLAANEFYEGFVTIISLCGKFMVGKMRGYLQLAEPQTVDIRHWPEGQLALESNCLFELVAPKDSKPTFFYAMKVIVRDLPLAEALKHSSSLVKPEGNPEDIDRQIKDKIISAALCNQEVNLNEAEKCFLAENFSFEYECLFGYD